MRVLRHDQKALRVFAGLQIDPVDLDTVRVLDHDVAVRSALTSHRQFARDGFAVAVRGRIVCELLGIIGRGRTSFSKQKQ